MTSTATRTVALLATLRQHGIVDDTQQRTLADLAPTAVWLTGLQALAAWLSALLISLAFSVLEGMVFQTHLIFGLLLVGAALALFLSQRDSVFGSHLALGLSLAGQGVLAFALDSDASLILSPLLALLLVIPRTSLLHRVLCLSFALSHTYWNLVFPAALGLVSNTLIALALALWLARRHWASLPQAAYMVTLAHSVTLLGLASLIMLQYIPAAVDSNIGAFRFASSTPWTYIGYRESAALVWLASIGWLIRALPATERACLATVAVILAVLAFDAPGMLLCLALMLATFYACQRAWLSIALLGACGSLGLFYYSLHQTLLIKSAMLAATGAALLGLRWLLRHWQESPSGESA